MHAAFGKTFKSLLLESPRHTNIQEQCHMVPVVSSAVDLVTNKCQVKIRSQWPGILVRVSIAVLKHHDQTQLLFHLIACPSSGEGGAGTQGRNLEKGTDTEAMA